MKYKKDFGKNKHRLALREYLTESNVRGSYVRIIPYIGGIKACIKQTDVWYRATLMRL